MARTIQQIRQDLAALEESVGTIAVELHFLYLEYLNLFSKSVQKQLIIATYQICTHKYPESFLRLSFNQRQQLQQKIRQIGQQIQPELFNLGKLQQSSKNQSANILEEMLNKLPVIPEKIDKQSSEFIATDSPNLSSDESDLTTPVITNPEALFEWQQQIEEKINQGLDKISRDTNHLLQETKILSHKLPAKLLDMAIEAEKSGSVMTGPPNLLNLMVESKSEEQEENAQVIHITAIRLRLAEIEFVETNLSSQRHQIRNLLAKLATIRQQYQKKQKELAIAEAETAWRSSWFDDN